MKFKLFMLALLFVVPVYADTIYLKNGKIVKGHYLFIEGKYAIVQQGKKRVKKDGVAFGDIDFIVVEFYYRKIDDDRS